MNCPNCGTPIEPGGKFCPRCGTKVVDAVPAHAASSPRMPASQAPTAPARPVSSAGSVAPVALFPYDVGRNRKYFLPQSIMTEIIIIVVAVLVLLTGFSMASGRGGMAAMLIIGSLIVGGLAGLSIYSKRDCPNDSQVDAMYEGIARIGSDEAIGKLGISTKEAQRVKPLEFSGRSWSDEPAKVFVRVGKDGVTRTSNYQVSFLYPGKEVLYCYAASQSLTVRSRRVKTADVFYEDVVDMSITETVSGAGGGGGFFSLRLSSGSLLEFSFGASQRTSVEGLRTLLREKKAEAGNLQREQLKAIKARM